MPVSKVLLSVAALGLCACSTLQPNVESPISGKNKGQDEDGSLTRSGAPTPVSHPASAQLELQAAAHWERLARDVAARIARVRTKFPPASRSLFVEPLDAGMPFAKAFHGYLIDHLLGKGQRVGLTRAGADRLRFTVQSISHENSDYTPPPGVTSVLVGGSMLASKIDNYVFRGIFPAIAAEALLTTSYGDFDAFSEVVISFTLLRGERMLARMSATYYVDDREMAQYLPSMPPSPLIVRLSGAAREPMPVRNFDVVSSRD
jgi:hypothetical protein